MDARRTILTGEAWLGPAGDVHEKLGVNGNNGMRKVIMYSQFGHAVPYASQFARWRSKLIALIYVEQRGSAM